MVFKLHKEAVKCPQFSVFHQKGKENREAAINIAFLCFI